MVPWARFSSALSLLRNSVWFSHLRTETLRNKLADGKVPERYWKLLSMNIGCGSNAMLLDISRSSAVTSGYLNHFDALLKVHRNCKATNPVDNVYALLGVSAKDSNPFITHLELLLTDYDMPVKVVYTRTMRGLIQSREDLGLLSDIEARPLITRIEGLPSWVPDFSAPLLPTPISFRQQFRNVRNCVTWKRCSRGLDDSLLDVRGFCVGSVRQTDHSVSNVQNGLPSQITSNKDQDHVTKRASFSERDWSNLCNVAFGLAPYYPILPDS